MDMATGQGALHWHQSLWLGKLKESKWWVKRIQLIFLGDFEAWEMMIQFDDRILFGNHDLRLLCQSINIQLLN